MILHCINAIVLEPLNELPSSANLAPLIVFTTAEHKWVVHVGFLFLQVYSLSPIGLASLDSFMIFTLFGQCMDRLWIVVFEW